MFTGQQECTAMFFIRGFPQGLEIPPEELQTMQLVMKVIFS
jgi:hypothetical protein